MPADVNNEGIYDMKYRFASMLAVVGMSLTGFAVAAPPASAWPWSSQVTLTGTVKTIYHADITGVYVSGSNGEHGWASLGGGNRKHSASYNYKFHHVGGGSGIKVTWQVKTKSGNFGKSFGVARPRTGANAVRNLCDYSPGC